MNGSLEGKTAIITEAGRGLGQAIAERFAEGATVVVPDVDEAPARKVADQIPGTTSHVCGVRDEEQVKARVDATVEGHGRLRVMVPNAGVGWAQPLPDVGLGYLNLDRAGASLIDDS
jgi:NAD(P)-dependent dehydrogenase (short-subunit alcohol dehydrogenase family)